MANGKKVIICVSGKMQSGKDTFSEIVSKHLSETKSGIAFHRKALI